MLAARRRIWSRNAVAASRPVPGTVPAGWLPAGWLSPWSPEVASGAVDPAVPGWVTCPAAAPTTAVDSAVDESWSAADTLDPDPTELDAGPPVAPCSVAVASPWSTEWLESAADTDTVDDWADPDVSSPIASGCVVAVAAEGPGDVLAVLAAELSSPLVTGVSGG